jgi:hypothetical protein
MTPKLNRSAFAQRERPLPKVCDELAQAVDPTNGAFLGVANANGQQRNKVVTVTVNGVNYIVKTEPFNPLLLMKYEQWALSTPRNMVAPVHLSVVKDATDGVLLIRSVYPFIAGEHPAAKCISLEDAFGVFRRAVADMQTWPTPHMDIQPLNMFMKEDPAGKFLIFIDPVDVTASGGATLHLTRNFKEQQNNIFFNHGVQARDYQLVPLFYTIFAHMVGLDAAGIQALVRDNKDFGAAFPALCKQIQWAIDQQAEAPEQELLPSVMPIFLGF